MQSYYDELSILGDDILTEIFLSLLASLESTKFNLDPNNCSLLDETWTLPECHAYELVPCDRLGIVFKEIDGRIVVTDIESGSVADDEVNIECLFI
jgi:hypothetical protein